jgi:hypothetical protein
MKSSARNLVAITLLLATFLGARLTAQDPLGLGRMWTFHNPPLAYLEQEYGFKPDQDWLDQVRLASLRFGRGCSASFVSPKGLILTNHHCARGNIADVQGDNDWIRDGFVAGGYDEEIRMPGLTVQQLVEMTDVTDRVERGITDGMDADEASELRQRNRQAILREVSEQNPKLRPQIVELFQGAQYWLYQHRIFDDIRLVMAPHLQAAHFGGDPDNFVYPRYATDFTFCRAYEDGKPADTEGMSFGWSDGPEPEQMIILTGNPGSTKRLLTSAQLEYLRDARYPRIRELIDNRIAIMRDMAKTHPEREKSLRTQILSLENGQKLYRGEHAALSDPAFMARKVEAEAGFRSRIAEDSALQERYGDTWAAIEAVARSRTALEGPTNFHSTGGSPHLMRAVALLRAVKGDRDADQTVRSMHIGDEPLQQAFFVDHLVRARNWLQPEDRYLQAVLQGREPAAAAARIQEESRMADNDYVHELLEGGQALVDASDDCALQIARVLLPLQESAARSTQSLDAQEETLGARIGRAVFAVYGTDVTPDATFTLRFSDGRPRGYDYNGTKAPWRSSYHGMFARSAEFANEHPFDLPEAWRLAQGRLDLEAAVDFVSTLDSTGGNSGSPVIDAQRRICGLLFDGNIESLGNEFFYAEDEGQRSVCVHPQGIVEALLKVYDCRRVVDELYGR